MYVLKCVCIYIYNVASHVTLQLMFALSGVIFRRTLERVLY